MKLIHFLLLSVSCIISFPSFAKSTSKVIPMTVTEKGFEPSSLKVKAGEAVTLKITRKTNATCAREITVPSQKLKVNLPLDKEVIVKISALPKGEIKFGCSMDMMIGGVILAE